MRFFLFLISFQLVVASAAGESYVLFREKDKIGIKDDAGKVIIPAAFEALGWSDGSFSVVAGTTGYQLGGHWGLINLKKEFLSRADYEALTWPGGDRIIARKKINAVRSATGCLDLKGNVSVPFIYDGIKIIGLRGIVFTRQRNNYRYGLVDLNGNELISCLYRGIRPLGTLRFALENDQHKTALFSDFGKAITDFSIDSISSFQSNYAIVFENLRQGLINRDGELVIPIQPGIIRIDADGSVWMRSPDEWKVMTGDNQLLHSLPADRLMPLTGNDYHIVQNNLHGIVDREFKTVLPMEYGGLEPVNKNQFVASQNGKYGIIHRNGAIVLPFGFDSVVADKRLIRVRVGNRASPRWMLYDTFGIRKTQKEFDLIGAFNGSFFPVKKNNYWGGVDQYGIENVHCVFDSIIQLCGNKIAVKFRGMYGIITTSEQWVVSPQVLPLTLVNDERYSVRSGTTVYLRDLESNTIYFTDNRIVFGKDFMTEYSSDGTEKQIDYQGRFILTSPPAVPPSVKMDYIFPISEGLRGIEKDGKYGFLDDKGRLRIANRYDGIGEFHESLAAVKILTKWGFIDSNDKIAIQPAYDEVGEFSDGSTIVRRLGKYGVLDRQGKVILPLRYDSVNRLPGTGYRLLAEGMTGVASGSGHILIDTRYDKVDVLPGDYFMVHRDGKAGLLTRQGLSTIPLLYDTLIYDRERNEYLGLTVSTWKKITLRQ